ncbi:hypothetical protein [Embleya sp. NBC_00896]|uniref:LppU/SCO3897 family protein n=1 Tax=Embleya sp. NBC_00896 TaxID=2975961 RepID=UPI00386327FB|nr:hypothetical protein OG928_07245 [Embleya sp. NBC_00896]
MRHANGSAAGVRALVGGVAAVLAMTVVAGCNGDKTNKTSGSAAVSGTASASTSARATTSPSSTATYDYTPSARASATGRPTRSAYYSPSATPSSTKTAYDKGECLSGRINTGGSQEQLDSVSCSDPKANFKVLRVYPYTTSGRPCDNVSGADYTYSSYWTLNGVPTYGSTYCLSEIG